MTQVHDIRGFFSDMDKTLVYSNRSAEFHELAPLENVVVGERYKNEPSGFVTLNAMESLKNFAREKYFVPTTTRSIEQYKRLTWVNHVWQETKVNPTYALVANGGILLEDGQEVTEYSDLMRASIEHPLDSVKEKLTDIYRRVESIERLLYVDNLFALFLVSSKAFSKPMFDSITEEFAEIGWKTSLQGKKLYLIPEQVSKENGMNYLKENVVYGNVIAAGDSLLDAGMLESADFAYRPPHGELETSKYEFRTPVVRLPRSGIRASTDLVHEVCRLSGIEVSHAL